MFFETFNDHKQYANTLREYSGYRIEETTETTDETEGDFDDYDASADQADEEYVDNHGFGGSDDDEWCSACCCNTMCNFLINW